MAPEASDGAELELYADVALELFKHMLLLADGSIAEAARASKAFRAVNKTCCNAFDTDKAGCKYLAKYVSVVYKREVQRAKCMRHLLRIDKRMGVRTAGDRKAAQWVTELWQALETDIFNYTQLFTALKYVVNGTISSMEIMHRAALPPHLRKHLSRTRNGLPTGKWTACRTKIRLAPFGTIKWAEALVVIGDERIRHSDQPETLAQRTVQALLRITKEEEELPNLRTQYDTTLKELLQCLSEDEEFQMF